MDGGEDADEDGNPFKDVKFKYGDDSQALMRAYENGGRIAMVSGSNWYLTAMTLFFLLALCSCVSY